ncbi:DUF1636 family protein [Thalassobaculum sp.]|uniref:DUF1636 family protein n=1 Tax=Thalassobaculum sp. TaxID=2022740 RepID=UPI003B58DE38
MEGTEDGIVVRLCVTCAPESGPADLERLRDSIMRAGLPVPVRVAGQGCLGACGEPVALSLQGHGRATYLFSGVRPEEDLADIAATLRLYLDSPNGWIEHARGCGRLRFCLTGRVPALEV